ncbi:bacterial luciferase family protein [Bacillus sp. JCM 19046]|uniref:Luciferase family oxidoreductase group 1 n=1 Tax=Shouchella xiaoxiensis TaxID=766895 RepID=A0ABS2SQ69_9BACI|nr:luciferase family oxidoreductase group 1 [Shouchella xiaoxiensis]GAF13262.1 bacterial luciferase family protein [Bacillus sp. JCM 19045]GAF17054.1 bacterial luciferase family protein [Bacillus sp. JCM 19046]
MKLSMLDQAPVSKGHSAIEALQFAERLALLGDELGFHRIWMAEHHSGPSVASSAPEITAAHLAAKTKRIRVGTGGVMMMHYSPLKLAEVFKTLSAFAPGRIDFGVGRAPGGDHLSIQALAEGRPLMHNDQYDKLATTLQLLNDQKTNDPLYNQVMASPDHVHLPEAWLLGSTGNSARQAGKHGVGYSFAQFFNGEMSKEIFEAYRHYFEPSYFMEKPYINVTYAATVAETADEAAFLALPIDLSRLFLMRGQIRQTLSPEEAHAYPLTEMDKALIEKNRKLHLVGTAQTVARQLEQEQQEFGFDEAMIVSNQHDYETRLTSYRLLAKELI